MRQLARMQSVVMNVQYFTASVTNLFLVEYRVLEVRRVLRRNVPDVSGTLNILVLSPLSYIRGLHIPPKRR
jgi:hypothetical protein